jgi:hypothetical protein
MHKGLTLQELATKLANERDQKKDMIVHTGSIRMDVSNGNTELVIPHNGSAIPGVYPLKPVAHDQISDYTKIPLKYYKKMHLEAPHLLADNVNTWFRRKPEAMMLRTLSGTGRAFLSNRYKRIDDEMIAEVALNALVKAGMRLDQVISVNVTDTRLYIQATLPNLVAEVRGSRRVGDVVHGGVVITNSEVGMGRVVVSEFDYYLACLNGMIGQKLLKKTHLGGAIEDDDALFADDTRRKLDEALVLQIRDMIGMAVDRTRFEKRVEKASNLTQIELKGNPTEAIEVMSKVLAPSSRFFTEAEEGSILNALVRGGDVSAWGLVNAVTAQANTETDYDRAVELETAGGKLLELGRSEWTRILDAK